MLTTLDSTEGVDPTEGITILTALDLAEGVDSTEGITILTALDLAEGVPMLAARDPTEGITILTALDLAEGVPMLAARDPTEGITILTVPDLAVGVPMLTILEGITMLMAPDPVVVPMLPTLGWGPALHPAVRLTLAFLTTPDPAKGLPVAFSTTPYAKAGTPVEVGRLSAQAQGSTEGDLNLRPNHHVRVWTAKRQVPVTATCSDTSKLPKGAYSPPVATISRNPPDGSWDQSRLSALGDGHLNLCPVAIYHVLAAARPLAKDESCPGLEAPGPAEEEHLIPGCHVMARAAASPLAKGESCPGLETPCPAEEERLIPSYHVLARSEASPTACLSNPGPEVARVAASSLAEDDGPPLAVPGPNERDLSLLGRDPEA
jgi:hypothetical protein